MKIKQKDLDPAALKKRDLIEELYALVRAGFDEKKAFYDVKINEDNPRKSAIIANRPGVELLATEMMIMTENYFDDFDDTRDSFEYLETGKRSVKKATVRFSKLEIIEYNAYSNAMRHNEAMNFNNGFTSTFWVIISFVVGLLALFGAVSVISFFYNR